MRLYFHCILNVQLNDCLFGLPQQYFDKDFKIKDHRMMMPQRQLDPYEENDVKGTRMPDYTKLVHERDIYGELGWINNFNVKFSKNNNRLHPNYREFFDMPKNYHVQFNNSTMTNSEFFRQNAPYGSVARQRIKSANRAYRGTTTQPLMTQSSGYIQAA